MYKKNGTEFQSFFENIMVKAFHDFQIIRPYGNKGDGGNDGYRKDLGIYYQVYAPNMPKTNESEASKKLKQDFEKLQKSGWECISKIKEYHFVFNDKYGGSIQKLEQAISELEDANTSIKFKLFLAKDLEVIFFDLDEPSILSLGFTIDLRQALSNASEYIENIRTELDRENARFGLKLLENVKDIVSNLEDENLSLEYEILECRCFNKIEKIDEAKEKYTNIAKRYPEDPRAFLYLAEIYLNDRDFDKNLELLQNAESLDKNFWLLKLEQLIRKRILGEAIDLSIVDEKLFPTNPKIKSSFYRLYALFFENQNDQINADSFIEKAIHSYPEGFSNYVDKLSILENRIFMEQVVLVRQQLSNNLLKEIEKVEELFFAFGDIGARNKAILDVKKLNALHELEDFPNFEKISKETFELSLNCFFNKQIEIIITIVLQFVSIPDDDLNQLIQYINNSHKDISDELSKVLVAQFNLKETLLSDGKAFFTEIDNQKFLGFIKSIEEDNCEEVLAFLKGDIQFAVIIANTLKKFPELRKQIIENLPNDENIQKEKLKLLLDYDEEDFDEAYSILKTLDLSELSYLECKPILHICQQKNAWDFEALILQRLIGKEEDKKQVTNLKIQLFNAHDKLKQYPEVIEIGTELLELDSKQNYLDARNKEALLVNTILACFERGKVEENAYAKAQEILEKYILLEPSFEFKVGIEAEVYLYNNSPQKALIAVIEGVKIKKTLSPTLYAKLYFLLYIRIGSLIDLELTSLNDVCENVFVKFKNKYQWYFVGKDNELDAIMVSETHGKYSLFENKKLGDIIVHESKYSSERKEDTIEYIFPIEKYVLWQVSQHFNKLSRDGDLKGVQLIDVPQVGDSIDPQNILKVLEDMYKNPGPFYEMYLNNNIPLAMLAVNEGGLTEAIGRIQIEQKGFINFCNGSIQDFAKQKEVARTVLKNKTPFYLDGTSALFMSEIGYVGKLYNYISSVKIPQSVINLLGEINKKFTYTPGQSGHMGYYQGKIVYSSIDTDKRDSIKKNIIESVRILESNKNNIEVISSANKFDCFSEKQIPAELSDACILAQNNNLPVMTEDYIYLIMNEQETKKDAPQHFSSLALLRVLYEEKKLSYGDYLEYFGYLSSYRFRFLTLSLNDIELAVFGDNENKIMKPENIKKFNFPLTLSEEYGVPFQTAISIVGRFLFKVLINDEVSVDVAEQIIIEILESFPTTINKGDIGQLLLRICLNDIISNKSKTGLLPNNDKFDRLFQATETLSQKENFGCQNNTEM
jgi:hypothetical protein